ncbi:MAG: hypothetical protein D6725_03415 [Planctomycetota bacterium]|nr:MAG: hypothetical protein D6725_03415 [Planctomycetota bacterium]
MSAMLCVQLRYDRRAAWLHRLCVLATVTALLPIAVGALVTTEKAGMAFADWPTSDGYSLWSYPWLRSAGDKFVEHGHRIAGALAGCVVLALALAAWSWERRRWVRLSVYGLLGAVVVQGVIGGLRVRLNAQAVAMLHALFANVVLTGCLLVSLATSRWWCVEGGPVRQGVGCTISQMVAAVALAVGVAVQYGLGSVLRHFGGFLHEHVVLGLGVFALGQGVAWKCLRSGGAAWVRRFGFVLALLLGVQVVLGGATYVSRFGLPALGWVAVIGSVSSRLFPTLHTCVGIVLVATVVNLVICLWASSREGMSWGTLRDTYGDVGATASGRVP